MGKPGPGAMQRGREVESHPSYFVGLMVTERLAPRLSLRRPVLLAEPEPKCPTRPTLDRNSGIGHRATSGYQLTLNLPQSAVNNLDTRFAITVDWSVLSHSAKPPQSRRTAAPKFERLSWTP